MGEERGGMGVCERERVGYERGEREIERVGDEIERE